MSNTSVNSVASSAQGDLAVQLSRLVDIQQDVIKSQKDTIESLWALVLDHKEQIDERDATIDRMEEEHNRQTKALEGMSAVRDAQEDKLDANTKEINDLKDVIGVLLYCLKRMPSTDAGTQTDQQTRPTEATQTHNPAANVTDEQLY